MKSIVLVALVLMLGCDEEMGTACTEEARSSVVLQIQNSANDEILDSATVIFTIDDGSPETLTCDSDENGISYCGSLVLAYEVEGVFEFTISATGYEDQTGTVTIERDVCHVMGEVVTVDMVSL